jgi:signal-transduction protein with cAMP-binding, CBS, and nucleotidyltransferase domain
MSRVRDILHQQELFSVEEHQSVSEVARHMAELHVGAILVVRDGELRGVFSERDLLTRVVIAGMQPGTTPVAEVMSTNIRTIDESASLEDAMESMKTHGCRHLPVMRDNKVVGFLSMRDLMNHELAHKTEEIHHMRAYIHGTA